MNHFARLLPASLCLAFTLAGCGSSTHPASPVAAPENVTGNWQFQVQLPAHPVTGSFVFPTNPIEAISGSLSSAGKSVSATLHATPLATPHCVEMDTALPFTGTTDSAGNLSLTAPLANGVATIVANLLTLQTVTLPDGTVRTLPNYAGTYQVVGGTCAQASIPLTIYSVPNMTGTYTGTFREVSIANLDNSRPPSTITATFVQASVPDASGKYALSGTITSTGGCNATYSFTSGAVLGSTAQSTDLFTTTFTIPSDQPIPVFQGSISPGSPRVNILGSFDFEGCNFPYSGGLTSQ